MSGAYYNEIDPYAAAWLRNLIAAGHIAPGDVDERDIRLVQPAELAGYTQCHFFAGIGVWSYALRLAGWSDDRAVWTGSCPCQPFSSAGAGQADEDDRHLAPAWLRLIRERRPAVVVGEQVGAAIRVGWLDALFAALELMHYTCGAVDFPACSVGAPHIRNRLFFVADSASPRRYRSALAGAIDSTSSTSDSEGHQPSGRSELEREGAACELADPERRGCEEPNLSIRSARQEPTEAVERRATYWSAADWIPCSDGKWRPVEPGTFPLAHGAAARVGRLRAYGNAIVAPAAAEFIRAYMSQLDIARRNS